MATITKSANGKSWIAVVRKNGVFKKRTFDTRRDAQEWAGDFESRIARADPSAINKPSKIPFVELARSYQETKLPKKKGIERERYAIKHLTDFFESYPISGITKQAVNNYKEHRLALVAESTVRREIDVLSSILTHAIKDHDFAISNTTQAIDKPAASKWRDRRVPDVEFDYIMRAFATRKRDKNGKLNSSGGDNPRHRLIAIFALETAMRQNEICTIDPDDIAPKYIQLRETKNGNDRKVPLSRRARAVVRLVRYISKDKDSDALFGVTANAVKLAWRRALVRARKLYKADCDSAGKAVNSKFLADLRFHDLRHEATSRLALKVPNVIELSSITGHLDLESLRRYYHTDTDTLADRLG